MKVPATGFEGVSVRVVAILCASLLVGCSDEELPGVPVSCPRCSIEIERVTVVGSAEDSIGLDGHSRTTLGPGGYYVSPLSVPGSISQYDHEGRFTRSVGRVGAGPGEYRGLTYVIGVADTVHVVDLAGARWTVLSSAHEVVRSTRLPMLGTSMVVLRDGRLAFYLSPQSGRDSTIPLHIVSSDGAVQSFGRPAGRDAIANYRIAPALDGGLWLLDMFSYTIEKWSPDGVLERQFKPERSWFPDVDLPPRNRTVQDNVRDRRTYGTSIRENADGLWVVVSVVNPKWRAPENIPLDANGFAEAGVTSDKYSAMVEVLDPRTGTLKAAIRARDPFSFMNDSLGYKFQVSEDGEVSHVIYKATLRQ